MNDVCPVCGSTDGNLTACNNCCFLPCPVCKSPVSWFGTENIESGVNVCGHVAIWGVVGGDAFIEMPEHESQLLEYARKHQDEFGNDDDIEDIGLDIIESYAKDNNLDYRLNIDQTAPSCCSPATGYFLFVKKTV